MASSIGDLVVNLIGRSDRLTKELRKGRKEVRGFKTYASNQLKAIGGTLAAGFAFGSLVHGFNSLRNELDGLAKTSAKLGLGADKLAGLRFGAEQSGLAVTALDTGLQRMVRRVSEAAQGTGEARAALAELNVEATELVKLSPDRQLGVIADAMAGVEKQTDRVRIAFKLFDTEGVGLVNLLKDGSSGLQAFQAEAEKLGIAFKSEDLDNVEKMNDSINRITQSVKGLGSELAVTLAPAIEKTSNSLTEVIAAVRGGINLGGGIGPAIAQIIGRVERTRREARTAPIRETITQGPTPDLRADGSLNTPTFRSPIRSGNRLGPGGGFGFGALGSAASAVAQADRGPLSGGPIGDLRDAIKDGFKDSKPDLFGAAEDRSRNAGFFDPLFGNKGGSERTDFSRQTTGGSRAAAVSSALANRDKRRAERAVTDTAKNTEKAAELLGEIAIGIGGLGGLAGAAELESLT